MAQEYVKVSMSEATANAAIVALAEHEEPLLRALARDIKVDLESALRQRDKYNRRSVPDNVPRIP